MKNVFSFKKKQVSGSKANISEYWDIEIHDSVLQVDSPATYSQEPGLTHQPSCAPGFISQNPTKAKDLLVFCLILKD